MVLLSSEKLEPPNPPLPLLNLGTYLLIMRCFCLMSFAFIWGHFALSSLLSSQTSAGIPLVPRSGWWVKNIEAPEKLEGEDLGSDGGIWTPQVQTHFFFLILACSLIPTVLNFHDISNGVRIQAFWLQNTMRSALHVVLSVLYLRVSLTGLWLDVTLRPLYRVGNHDGCSGGVAQGWVVERVPEKPPPIVPV